MSPTLRCTVLLCALFVLAFVIRKLRKSKINTPDSIFWLFMSFCFLVNALFPKLAYFFSDLLGFQSPSNFIFLIVIGLMLIRELMIQQEVTELKTKVTQLIEEIALRDHSNK